MVFWSLSMITSVVMLVLSAAMRENSGVHMAYSHMAIAAAVSVSFALIFVRENETLRMQGARQSLLDANSARFSGIVWAWAALALSITYGTGILHWREWLTFFLVCITIGGLCFVFGDLLKKDAAKDTDDHAMLKLGRYLMAAQFGCGLIIMVGLVLDGKMTRFLTPRYTDWAANNIFFFGALALVAISAYALNTKQRVLSPSNT